MGNKKKNNPPNILIITNINFLNEVGGDDEDDDATTTINNLSSERSTWTSKAQRYQENLEMDQEISKLTKELARLKKLVSSRSQTIEVEPVTEMQSDLSQLSSKPNPDSDEAMEDEVEILNDDDSTEENNSRKYQSELAMEDEVENLNDDDNTEENNSRKYQSELQSPARNRKRDPNSTYKAGDRSDAKERTNRAAVLVLVNNKFQNPALIAFPTDTEDTMIIDNKPPENQHPHTESPHGQSTGRGTGTSSLLKKFTLYLKRWFQNFTADEFTQNAILRAWIKLNPPD